jgi:hypothetical protein
MSNSRYLPVNAGSNYNLLGCHVTMDIALGRGKARHQSQELGKLTSIKQGNKPSINYRIKNV